jgi:hypothetical protein
MLSAWRLATIVRSRPGTAPSFDPSWTGSISAVLASLEICAASICASVPVFWPVLTAKLDQIFVVKEVTVSRSDRFSTVGGGADENDIEMNMGATSHLHRFRPSSSYSGSSSAENLTGGKDSTTPTTVGVPMSDGGTKKTYVSDSYFTAGQYVESEFTVESHPQAHIRS